MNPAGVVHLCPAIGKHEMPCCRKPATDMPAGVLLTQHPERVTCTGPESARKEGLTSEVPR